MTHMRVESWWRDSLVRRGQDPARWDIDPRAQPLLGDEDDIAAICVLARFEVDSYVRSLVAMVSLLSPQERHRWYRAFTRVVLLAGDPRKVAHRHRPDHLDDVEPIAWFRPRPRVGSDPLSRLLTLFTARGPASGIVPCDSTIGSPDAGTRLDIRLDVDRMTVSECMIHLAHCVAEPFASGAWDGTSAIRVRRRAPDAEDVATGDYIRLGIDASGVVGVVGVSRVAPVARLNGGCS